MSFDRHHLRAAIAALVGATAVFLLSAVGGLGSVGTACAQVPTTPSLFPDVTVGPLDPTCQRVPDTDADGVWDYEDNCQGYFNPSQRDTDEDSGPKPYEPVNVTVADPATGGDACDVDDDNDGAPDVRDVCPKLADPSQKDTDGDGVGDACDPSPDVPNQVTTPSSGSPDAAASAVPKLTIRGLRGTHHVPELGAGLAVPVRCSAPCTLTGELRADARTAKRLGLKGSRRVSRAVGGLAKAGDSFVFLRLTSAQRKRLHRLGRVRLTLSVVAANDSGRRSTVQRRVTILR